MTTQPITPYIQRVIAAEISATSRYYDQFFQWKSLEHDDGTLFRLVDNPNKQLITEEQKFPSLNKEKTKRSMILLNGTINHHLDIQELLSSIRSKLSRTTRLGIVAYNPYLRGLYQLANRWGLRKGEEPSTFITHTDLNNLAKLAGYEVVSERPTVYCPFELGGLGNWINRILPTIPLLRWLGLVSWIVLRPVMSQKAKPSLSIVIPARNEAGNIENALKRMPKLSGAELDIIFVEGHSQDNTWEEIQRVQKAYSDRFSIQAFQQTGKGKNDAVRLGFQHAKGELLTILDADLTMPPEKLELFYDAYCQGLADFINGNRLVYPMEGQAMRFLNRLGNIFFAKALSWVLNSKLGDSLCGTKLLSRHDYERVLKWRDDFGDFDPFGDYELLFPASVLALGIVDIPIHYRARTYGDTNIDRFSHGWMLLKMTLIGLLRIKSGKVG